MNRSQLLGTAVGALALLGGAAQAADSYGAPAMNWSGLYLGIQSGYDFDGYVPVQGVIGYNFGGASGLVLGVEGAYGRYFGVNGGSDGFEGYIVGRLGVPMGNALLYGMGGLSIVDSDTGGIAGAGVEMAKSRNFTFRGQVAYYFEGGSSGFGQATLGLIWRPR